MGYEHCSNKYIYNCKGLKYLSTVANKQSHYQQFLFSSTISSKEHSDTEPIFSKKSTFLVFGFLSLASNWKIYLFGCSLNLLI